MWYEKKMNMIDEKILTLKSHIGDFTKQHFFTNTHINQTQPSYIHIFQCKLSHLKKMCNYEEVVHIPNKGFTPLLQSANL